jgi:sugar phosphate isomerase/epimerase
MKAAGGSLLANPQLVLCSLSMVPIGFRDLVAAASAGGFDAISVGPPVYRRARRDEGLTAEEMRGIVDDSGLFVSEVESVGNWLTPLEDKPPRWAQRTTDREFMDLAEALGSRSIVAGHFGTAQPVEAAAHRFGALCDQAAGRGFNVALEFPAFATINDLHTAWDVVREADRPNGGLLFDTWHFFRGAAGADVLRTIPGNRIMGVQLADADQEVRGSLEDDILLRRLPGEGALDLSTIVAELDAIGVDVPVGIEVWDKDLLAQGPDVAARRLGDATRRFLASVSPASRS